MSRAKSAVSDYLLTGLLVTPDGQPWTGHKGRYYRLKASDGRKGMLADAAAIDAAVLAQVGADMRAPEFVKRLAEIAHTSGLADDPAAPVAAEIARLEKEKARAAALALTSDADTFGRLVEERSHQIAALTRELTALRADAELTRHLQRITPAQIREALLALGPPRDAIGSLVGRVTLDRELGCQIHYKAGGWLSNASPRGFDGWAPGITSAVRVA